MQAAAAQAKYGNLQPKAPNTSNNNVSYLINKNFAEKKV
jgi:hypothetical protein